MNYTEEQIKDIQSRIDIAAKKIAEILKESDLVISGKISKIELQQGIFVDTVNVGYSDIKYLPKKDSGIAGAAQTAAVEAKQEVIDKDA